MAYVYCRGDDLTKGANMNIYNACWYEVIEARNNFSLPDKYFSKKDAIDALRVSNKKEQDGGYPESKLLVYKVDLVRIFDEEGIQYEQTTKTCVYK